MRILSIDIETTPIVAHTWGIWQQNIGLSQILEATRMMCFVAKWKDEKKPMFFAEWDQGFEEMIKAAHALLNEADVVVYFNGDRFDRPHLNREFIQQKLGPPSPYQTIDLLGVVKKNFRFPSNKLAYILPALGFEGKVAHEGHSLWIKCMAGDAKAQKKMATYNRRDVTALEDLYTRLLPWITEHPPVGLFQDVTESYACPNCGSVDLLKDGFAYTTQSKFQRYQCRDCGRYSRDNRRVTGIKRIGTR